MPELPLLLLPLADVDIFGQTFAPPDLAVIGLLIVLEGVLSIDNALVLGLLAKRLKPEQRSRALFYGLAGAFAFRFVAISTASFLLRWTVVKLLGGGYLVYIAVKHLVFEGDDEEEEKIELDEHGHPKISDDATGKKLSSAGASEEPAEGKRRWASFWPTVLVIELTDVAFAVDSILAAIALVGAPPPGVPAGNFHPKLWVVITGGLLGVILMRFAATMFIRLLERFPRFEMAAYLLVMVIGLKLLGDWGANPPPPAPDAKPSQHYQLMHPVAESYHTWLVEKWPLGVAHKEFTEDTHLLDFHDYHRPEFIAFWLLMVVSFCVGFLPEKRRKTE